MPKNQDPYPPNWSEMDQKQRQNWLDLQKAKKNLPKNDPSIAETINNKFNREVKKNQQAYIKAFPKGGKVVPMKGSPNIGMVVAKKKALKKAASKVGK